MIKNDELNGLLGKFDFEVDRITETEKVIKIISLVLEVSFIVFKSITDKDISIEQNPLQSINERINYRISLVNTG